ncbi:uncharacterized protein CMU_018640 [Cryptosporidium muris RN66]|uniref:Uncharacterized protein n=1 Tax=Cryptosporidium muris (strain RN66) TaxID=441375 RepID=B6ADA3_CRYMR|nr:uncharacterized protein CMU_018640 [Cryptosporidium muris RN66]EEA06107.1 hypothetical protein CMU_018640 [Cryptosporidium muris RN66]|eukprot:XP_002140456.1 hypothetical protein [Cryptosporidium muris RN66]
MNFKLSDVIIIDNPEIRVLNQRFLTRKKHYSGISLNANNQEIKVNDCSCDIRVLDFNPYSIYSGKSESPKESLNNQSYIQASIVSTKNQFQFPNEIINLTKTTYHSPVKLSGVAEKMIKIDLTHLTHCSDQFWPRLINYTEKIMPYSITLPLSPKELNTMVSIVTDITPTIELIASVNHSCQIENYKVDNNIEMSNFNIYHNEFVNNQDPHYKAHYILCYCTLRFIFVNNMLVL